MKQNVSSLKANAGTVTADQKLNPTRLIVTFPLYFLLTIAFLNLFPFQCLYSTWLQIISLLHRLNFLANWILNPLAEQMDFLLSFLTRATPRRGRANRGKSDGEFRCLIFRKHLILLYTLSCCIGLLRVVYRIVSHRRYLLSLQMG